MSSKDSKLSQIQLRYQQKQMQEMSQKKNEKFEDSQKMLASSLGTGKVRAMFDERRHRITAGIDKSFLLDPISVETKTSTMKKQVIAVKPTRYDQKMSNYSKVIMPPLQSRLINSDINGNNHLSVHLSDETFRSGELKLRGKPSEVTSSKTVVFASSQPQVKNMVNQKTNSAGSFKSGSSATSPTNSMKSPKKTSIQLTKNEIASGSKLRALKEKTPIIASQSSFDENAPVPEGLIRCGICKRNFAEDRIEKHQVICQKTKVKKRKVYDASKKRVQGTEAESYLKNPILAVRNVPKATLAQAPKANNWRSKHEDFIKAIRAAKEMQQYLAKGGKLSDLKPPEPSLNLDYVQCPHCQRRFNESAAARHIPLCLNMQHNKPKPRVSKTLAGKLSTKKNSR